MILTREIVDALAPEHDRTSCNDHELTNRHGGWYGRYRESNGEKLICYPRCVRCYLLAHLGECIDTLEFKPVIISLEWNESV